MEVRIGIVDTSQSVALRLADDTGHEELEAAVEDALGGETPVLRLSDANGRKVMVAASRITHVEIIPSGAHHIGFG